MQKCYFLLVYFQIEIVTIRDILSFLSGKPRENKSKKSYYEQWISAILGLIERAYFFGK